MTEHVSDSQIENFTMRRLAPGELAAFTRHLAACMACRAHVEAQAHITNRTAVLQAALRAESLEHLSYEQLVAYVEETTLPLEQELISNHLTVCPQCVVEIEELQTLRATLAAASARKNWWAWLSEFTFLRPWPIAVAAMALLSLLVVAWWMRKSALVSQVVSAPPLTNSPPVPSATPSPAPAAVVIATLQDKGQVITLDQAGNISGLSGLAKDAEQAVRQALTTQQIEVSPAVKKLRHRTATLMSGGEEQETIRLQSPVGTFVSDVRPTFHWQALPAAEQYVVQVLDVDFNVVATSEALTQNHWRSTMLLKRGQEYVWQVTATVAGKRVTSNSASTPEAHFKLLSAEKARALQASVQAHDSHLLSGTMYAEAGLLDDAEREYQALLRANPRSNVARRLLSQLRAARK